MSTNLPRIHQKIFGLTASETTPKRIAQFGSVVAGDPNLTGDIEEIQALNNWEQGWVGSTVTERRYPTAEETTGVNKVLSQQLAYLFQKGIPEWCPDVTYFANTGFCQKNGVIYQSLTDQNINNDPENDFANWKVWNAGNGYEVGDVIWRPLPSQDAGKHLLDGTRLSGDGIYKSFVDYIANLYADNIANKYSNIIKYGSLTDNSGVLSGFSVNNYATLPQVFNPSSYSWEVVLCITLTNTNTDQRIFCTDDLRFHIGVQTNKIHYWLGTGSSWNIANIAGTNTLSNNTKYYVKVEFTGNVYNFYLSTDGINYNLDGSVTSSVSIGVSTITKLGVNQANNFPMQGSIDLNSSYINIDDQRWWTGRQVTGFILESEWQQSVTNYGVCGKFVYDDVNNTVRLPKITGIVEGTIDASALGDLVEAGLPNITGSFATEYGPSNFTSGAFTWENRTDVQSAGGTDNNGVLFRFNASRSDNTYGNLASGAKNKVQPQTIKGYMYIVVANSVKTQVEIDIDEIVTDLNKKGNTDADNFSTLGKETITSWGVPDYDNPTQTTFAIDTVYQAPCDGLVMCPMFTGTGAGYCLLNISKDNINWQIYEDLGTNCVFNKQAIIPKGYYYKFTGNTSNVVIHAANTRGFYPLKGAQ